MGNETTKDNNNNETAAQAGEEIAESEEARAERDDEVTEPGARRAGAVKLTDRDKDMLGLLVLARYMTMQQVRRLYFEGRHVSLAYRRLQRLTRAEGGPPFLRRRFFRTYDGNRVAVWAPTPHGLAAAALRIAGLPELPRHDVGANFLEHTIQLNELLVALWRTADGRPARPAQVSFRWTPSDAVRLMFNEYVQASRDVPHGHSQLRVIQPDAMLELPAQRRRYFLECEMGGHTITPGPSRPPGATLSKVERYLEFVAGFADSHRGQTFYLAQYPDAFAAEVLFLVRSAGRAGSINSALASWRVATGERRGAFRAVTFDEAAAELRGRAGLPPLPQRRDAVARGCAAPAPLTLTPEEAELLHRYLFESKAAVHRARNAFREIRRTDLPEYPRSLDAFQALVGRLSAGAPPS